MIMIVKGILYPYKSLSSLCNGLAEIYTNACVIPNRTDESGCYFPEPILEMAANSCSIEYWSWIKMICWKATVT